MTEPAKQERDREREPEAERELQVEVELVKDLDVPREAEEGLRGGCSHTTAS